MSDKFRWLGRSTVTRSKEGSSSAALETGRVYSTADFTAHVVAEWIYTGNAEAVEDKVTDTVLDVKSPTVKIKTPKLGEKF